MDSQNRFIDVSKFLAARSKEIVYLDKILASKKYAKTTRVFQNLPKHMRRRAMSHNRKRIPSRIRNLKALDKNFGKKPGKRRKFITKTGRMYRKRLRRKLFTANVDTQLLYKVNSRIEKSIEERFGTLCQSNKYFFECDKFIF